MLCIGFWWDCGVNLSINPLFRYCRCSEGWPAGRPCTSFFFFSCACFVFSFWWDGRRRYQHIFNWNMYECVFRGWSRWCDRARNPGLAVCCHFYCVRPANGLREVILDFAWWEWSGWVRVNWHVGGVVFVLGGTRNRVFWIKRTYSGLMTLGKTSHRLVNSNTRNTATGTRRCGSCIFLVSRLDVRM